MRSKLSIRNIFAAIFLLRAYPSRERLLLAAHQERG